MKIAILSISNGIIERGAETFVKEIASAISVNHDVCVFQIGKGSNHIYKVKEFNFLPFVYFQGETNEGIAKNYLWRIFYDLLVFIFTLCCMPFLIYGKYDWIIPINGRLQVVLCRLIRLFIQCKILISGQSGIGFDDRFNIVVGKPDVFIGLSSQAYRWAQNISDTKVAKIPNGVDISKFFPSIQKHKTTSPSHHVLCISALLRYKNIDLLIDAISKLQNTNLTLIGTGPERNTILNLAQKKLGNRFHYISHVTHDNLRNYYQKADVFSLPSGEREAFGIVYVEAMACNVAVVAPNFESRREIIGDAGVYFKPSDADDYALCLEKAINTNFGSKPRKQAEKFSWISISKQYEQTMEQN